MENFKPTNAKTWVANHCKFAAATDVFFNAEISLLSDLSGISIQSAAGPITIQFTPEQIAQLRAAQDGRAAEGAAQADKKVKIDSAAKQIATERGLPPPWETYADNEGLVISYMKDGVQQHLEVPADELLSRFGIQA